MAKEIHPAKLCPLYFERRILLDEYDRGKQGYISRGRSFEKIVDDINAIEKELEEKYVIYNRAEIEAEQNSSKQIDSGESNSKRSGV